MFLTAAAIASLVGVSAFAPAGRIAGQSALKMGFEFEAAVTSPPAGFFDPLGLASPEIFEQFRTAKLKLAVIGYIVPDVLKWRHCPRYSIHINS